MTTDQPAVCFCGTILTVTRTGRYPASLVFREPGLSSNSLKKQIRNHLRLLFPSSSLVANKPKLLAIDSYLDKSVGNQLITFRILQTASVRLLMPVIVLWGLAALPSVILLLSWFKSYGNCPFQA